MSCACCGSTVDPTLRADALAGGEMTCWDCFAWLRSTVVSHWRCETSRLNPRFRAIMRGAA